MVDLESVRRRLRKIDRRIGLLEAIRRRGRDAFLADLGLQAQVERHLQLALQAAIDVALHVVAEASADTPENYGAAFVLLAEGDVLDEALAARMRQAAGLRNVLVHAYLEVDPSLIWEHLQRLDDLRNFAAAAEHRLQGA